MSTNRIIDEKYWGKFKKTGKNTSAMRHDGNQFEALVHRLLELMYDGISWERTQMTHDGNKDFKGQKGNELYWAECKNYKASIDLKTLAATLVMAEIDNVNAILFFCYSEINMNTKKKLCSFSKSTQKKIYFYDGPVLDQLILKYKDYILEDFFPDYLDDISTTGSVNEVTPQAFCYLERNPLLNGSVTFDMDNLQDMQDLRIGEVIGIHLVVINRNLSKSLKISYKLDYMTDESPFFPINADIKVSTKSISFPFANLAPGELCHKIIYLKYNKYFPTVEIPRLTVRCDNLKSKHYKFGTISTLSIRRSVFLGSNYLDKMKELSRNCLNKNRFSIVLLYGSSGTGKTRMLYECSDLFLGHGYQIINFKHGNSQTSFYSILQELAFALYGFDEMIIDHIVENNYDELDAYNTKSYKEIFKILKTIYEKRTSLKDISLSEYAPLYEKMSSGKFMIILDDIQNYSAEVIDFFQAFVEYVFNKQRKCSSVMAMGVNTDSLYSPQIINFLTLFEKSNIDGRDNIYNSEISGFETESQSQLLLKEVLGIDEEIFEDSDLKGISLRPKYIIEFSNLLMESHAIEVVNGRAFITDKTILKSMLGYLSKPLEAVIDERWRVYRDYFGKDDSYYKILISCLLFLGEINLEYEKNLKKYDNDIYKLCQHGFLKQLYADRQVYTFEHDTIKNYFLQHYKDWIETAIELFKQSIINPSEKSLRFVYNVYIHKKIETADFEEYKRIDFPNDILLKISEYILRLELRQCSSDNNFFDVITEICKKTRENLGEEKVVYLYEIFEHYCDSSIIDKNIGRYCRIILDYAENQIKLKNTQKSIDLYQKVIQYIANTDFNEKSYIQCVISNRWFVCGRVGGECQQYNYHWVKAVGMAQSNKYCRICIENHFDKAQSLFLVPQNKSDVVRHLKAGCAAYENLKIQELDGHYLYRKIQIAFLEKNYKMLYNEIENALYNLLYNNSIQFKLFFKIQFLIFKIMLCLMKEHACTDIELKKMLDELNLLQTMQNHLQLYRCYYLYGKYYIQRKKWELSFLFFRKAFAKLDENIPTEEIREQKRIILEDMVINLKKYSFPIKKFDFSDIQKYEECDALQEIIDMSDEEFNCYYKDYCSPAPVSSSDCKDGYLLF